MDQNPYAAPAAPLSHSDSSDHFADPGGIRRRTFWIVYFIFYALLVLMFVALIGDMSGDPDDIVGAGWVIQLLGFAIAFPLTMFRLQNAGYSKWLGLLIIVPLANLVVGFMAAALPTNYAHHKQLDLAAKIIIGILVGCFALMIIGVIAAIAIPTSAG